ncbi:MAG: autotransporter outer membrane beta-barrel domain-containing protein, partial [Proteobacteria bacterium]|nr:autotransporter outer membrane beta-barrel domain-containing protein [Pseudomonadota bacterium]
ALAVTPFARLQGSTTTQNGFTESGADSLNLTVAGQTTNSLRTTLGADLGAELARMAFGVRLGWQHEHADTGRPMTASFAGAPGQAFTVTGATPQRDSAVLGFSFNTHVAETTELYARYDGEVGGGSDNHAFTAGLRMTW